MAIGTRSKETFKEGLRNTDSRVQELMNSHHQLQRTVDDVNKEMKQMQSTMELMMAEFHRNLNGKGPAHDQHYKSSGEMNINAGGGVETNSNANQRNFYPRFDFPIFNGVDVKNWIMKCEHFFQIHPMNDMMRLRSVALHLEGQAGPWFLAYFKSNSNVSWK